MTHWPSKQAPATADKPINPTVLLDFMYDPAKTDMGEFCRVLAKQEPDFARFVINNADLSKLSKSALATIGKSVETQSIKNAILDILGGEKYMPRPNPYWATAALLMLLEPTPDSVATWADYQKKDKSIGILYYTIKAAEALQLHIDISPEAELDLLSCFKGEYRSRHEFNTCWFGTAYKIFNLRHDGPLHQKCWQKVFSNLKPAIKSKTVTEMLEFGVAEVHFRWSVDMWCAHPDNVANIDDMPDGHKVREKYPKYAETYEVSLNMLRIMGR